MSTIGNVTTVVCRCSRDPQHYACLNPDQASGHLYTECRNHPDCRAPEHAHGCQRPREVPDDEPQCIDRTALATAMLAAACRLPVRDAALAAARQVAARRVEDQPARGSAWYGDGQPALTVAQANAAIKEFAVTVSNDDGPSQWEVREAVLDALERGLKAPRGDGTVTVLPVVQRPSRGRQSQFRYVTEPEPGPRVCGNISCRKPLDGRPPLVRYCCNSCRVVAFKRRKRQA